MNTTDHIVVGDSGTRYWAGEGNAASGVLPVCPKPKAMGTVCLAWRSARVMSPNVWSTIGGAVKPGLTPAENALRELQEETGYTGPIKLIPAHVFRDGAFSYHNFIGVVPEEFHVQRSATHASENDCIAWRRHTNVANEVVPNFHEFHPGVRELLIESDPEIRTALFGPFTPRVLAGGALTQEQFDEWFVGDCSKVRDATQAEPDHWINRQLATERVSGPLFRGMKLAPDNELLTLTPGDIWRMRVCSFTKRSWFAAHFANTRRLPTSIRVAIIIHGWFFPGIDVTRHVPDAIEEEVLVAGRFKVVHTEWSEGNFFIFVEPADVMPTEGRKLWLDDVRPAPDGWDLARTFEEFVSYIEQNGVPDAISFDYDLERGKTGLACARWLLERGTLPRQWSVHSANRIGRMNIIKEMAAAEVRLRA
jgi:8-oxo-dGTP pyrophosphatase MutT (NUDIX family)